MEFQINDWVQHNRTSYKGSVVDIEGAYIRVHWFLFNNGKPLVKDDITLHHSHELKLLPPEPRIFSYDELDIALLTKDKAWYEEIMSLEGEKVD